MKPLATIRIALRALRRNKMRSVLTALGIIIGVGAVITTVGIGSGAKSQVEAQIASLGESMLLIFPGSINASGARTGWGNTHTLTLDDAEAIRTQIKDVVAVSPENTTRAQVIYGNQNWSTRAAGESPEYLSIRKWPLAGQVLGVLQAKGLSPMGSDQDDIVLVPYTTELKRIHMETWLDVMLVQAVSRDALSRTEQEINDLLRQRHHIDPARGDDFTVRSQEDIAQAATATARTMTFLLGAIACVSLIVGGIGIMNIMLVSVTERTREIGIRMAVGAHGRDILLQFLIEAMTLSSVGGIIGIICGVGASKILSIAKGWPTLVSPTAVVISFLFSAAVGVFFGFYPARKAAQLDPIEALRYE
ncbi:MAG: ABC transporter permease [Verrucomicrobiia bacterium]